MKITLKLLTILGIIALIAPVVVAGQATDVPIGAAEDIGLEPIYFPLFVSLTYIRNFSIFSYLALLLALAFFALLALWVSLAVRASITVLSSEGDTTKIEVAKKKITNMIASIAILFLFYIVISFVATIFGLGGIWDWPKQLSICQSGKMYATLVLENPNEQPNVHDEMCFGTRASRR